MSDEVDYRRRGSRFRARKRAVALLFEAELRDADVVELAEERRRMGAESQEFHDVASYTMDIVTGVAERLDRLDSMISEHLREGTLERLPAEKSVGYVNAVLDRVAGLAQHIRAAERAVSTIDTASPPDVSEPTPDATEAGAED